MPVQQGMPFSYNEYCFHCKLYYRKTSLLLFETVLGPPADFILSFSVGRVWDLKVVAVVDADRKSADLFTESYARIQEEKKQNSHNEWMYRW